MDIPFIFAPVSRLCALWRLFSHSVGIRTHGNGLGRSTAKSLQERNKGATIWLFDGNTDK